MSVAPRKKNVKTAGRQKRAIAMLPAAVDHCNRAGDASGKAPSQSTGGTIAAGERNDTLFAMGCELRRIGLPEELIETSLLSLNTQLCRPPLQESDVRAIAKSAASVEAKVNVGFVARLLQDVELWHDENDDPHITLTQDGHHENWKIDKRSKSFRRWLSKRYWDATRELLKSEALGNLAGMLEGQAVFSGPEHSLFRRTAQHGDKLFVDLCDAEWRAIEIDANGWRIVSDPPVKFRRARAMLPLPEPVEALGTELKELLRPFLNIQETQWPLVLVWLVSALRPKGPYPILKLLGEQGSAKTTAARVLRSVTDPNSAPVRAEPRSVRDLMISANNAWVVCLDNLSTLKADLSDALCRLSTGGGFGTRTLYSDDDETIFEGQRPVILTSIEEIGTRSDFLERSLIIELPVIREGARKAERAFWEAFEKARPKIFGALLDALAGAIRLLPVIEQRSNPELPRLADFQILGQAVEVPLGLKPGTFAESYTANLLAATHTALESSPLVAVLFRYLEKNRRLEGTATELLEKLNSVAGDQSRDSGWPKNSRVVSQIFRRIAPNLRQVGITAEQGSRGGGNEREKIWIIAATAEPTASEPARQAPYATHLKASGVASLMLPGTQKTRVRPAKTPGKRGLGAKGRKGRR